MSEKTETQLMAWMERQTQRIRELETELKRRCGNGTELVTGTWFPVLPTQCTLFRVPWQIAEAAYEVYVKHHGTERTLQQIAEAGGFGIKELVALLADVEDSPT